MKFLSSILVFLLVSLTSIAHAADGLITLKSPYSAEQTMDRLELKVKERGLKIFTKIDHTAGAASVGLTLRPTVVLIFGNPKGGTPFMQCAQTAGIDFPLKGLVWEDASGQVWLSYNDPAWIAKRHGATDCPAVEKISKVLAGIAEQTTAK